MEVKEMQKLWPELMHQLECCFAQ